MNRNTIWYHLRITLEGVAYLATTLALIGAFLYGITYIKEYQPVLLVLLGVILIGWSIGKQINE